MKPTRKMKTLLLTAATLALIAAAPIACCGQSVETRGADITETSAPLAVPAAGNSYHTAGPRVAIPDRADGAFSLADPSSVVDVYFRVGRAGELRLGLVGSGPGEVKVTAEGLANVVEMPGTETRFYPVGTLTVDAGYVKVSLSGRGDVAALRIGGAATLGTNNYCTVENLADRAEGWSLWARRGPSVHMSYPTDADAEYFYNELTVDEGQDVVASYFMTNGFGEGYCGFQVNSPTERRILFSVWSPYSTDDPHTIPPDQEVVLVRRGPGVRAQDFGGEGSGGQSYLVYPWRADVTYKVLTRVRYHGPSGFESFPHLNDYTAWFFDPEQDSWRLIAQWRRPDKAKKGYTRAHSFLENFSPAQGWIAREAGFGNQWTCNAAGVWTEVAEAAFTHDNTARRGIRADYWGGVKDGRFVLRNCGFFDGNTPLGTVFTRPALGAASRPSIDLNALDSLPSE